MPATLQTVPELSRQAERLIELGVHEIGGLSATELRAAVAEPEKAGALLVIHPDRAPASALVPLLERSGKRGFIVVDMPDIDDFSPIEQAALPPAPVYLDDELERGDQMANWSPDEALPAITAVGRTPLTVGEGIQWFPRCPHPRALDQQRHRSRRPGQPRRSQTRMVLGRQSAHLAGVRVRLPARHRNEQRCPVADPLAYN